MKRNLFVCCILSALWNFAFATTGEDCTDPFVITGLPPQTLLGNTCAYQNDYDASCPDPSSTPDVVYRYSPAEDQSVNFSLCQSNHDTKLYIYEDVCSGDPIACNDNDETGTCLDGSRSYLRCVQLSGGHGYFIVVDGAGEDCGDYELRLTECLPERPCQSCTPPDADLGDVTTVECGDSISGNLGHSGKWVAQFTGIMGATYHWDLCPFDPCAGTANIGGDGLDVDLLIFDADCQYLDGVDGVDTCEWRPNDWIWTCPANASYFVIIAPYPAWSGDTLTCSGNSEHTFTLVYYRTEAPPPSGETCADAIPIAGPLPMSVAGQTCEHQNDYDFECPVASLSPDLVFHYWPPADQSVSLDLCQSNFNTKLYVYADACVGEPIACNDNDEAGICDDILRSYLSCVQLQTGHDYFIVVDGAADECGDFMLTLSPCPGETCTDAGEISAPLPATVDGNTCNYTNDYDVVCWEETANDGKDVVYRYTPSADGFLTFSLCESDFDTKLFLFADSCVGDPIYCNNNDPTETCGDFTRSYLPCVELHSGHTYFIVVDGVDEWQCGRYSLTISSCTPIPGDVIQTAFVIPSLPYTDSGTTVGFLDQYAEECGGRSYAPDVVYAYAPPTDMVVEVDLCHSCFDTRIYIYENSRSNMIACDDNGCWPSFRSYLPEVYIFAGNTYYFVVDGDWDQKGAYELTVLEREVGRCCPLDGSCHDYVSSRQCSYHLGRGAWTASLDCATQCPPPPPPPADPLRTFGSPVVGGCGYGITMAANCASELFYNNTCSDTLYKIDEYGQLLSAVGVTLNGWPSWFSLGCWDEGRQML